MSDPPPAPETMNCGYYEKELRTHVRMAITGTDPSLSFRNTCWEALISSNLPRLATSLATRWHDILYYNVAVFAKV